MNQVFKVFVFIIAIVIFINFIIITLVGVYKTFHAVTLFFQSGLQHKPGIEIVESLDVFLVALLFLILSLSIMKLFYPENALFSSINLPWLQINDFVQLKNLTWNAFLLTLLITFGTSVIKNSDHLDWTFLIIPIAVLLFAISAKMLRH
ncbi:MAG: YqhA family protein [Bacteroidia bacterium]|nr:YqhA family protein [Bacteroidia bacterium]HQU99671.1 YqhA family protein [Bacteroidia bacterium]